MSRAGWFRLRSSAGVPVLLVALLVWPSRVRGEGAAGVDGPLVLVVNSDEAAFSWARIRQAVQQALVVPVIADADPAADGRRGTLTIAWRPSRHELAVTYDDRRGTIGRIVAAPARTDEGVEAAVALAVNLVLDQVSQILGPPSTPTAPAAPPATPPSAPPPPETIQRGPASAPAPS